MMFFRALLLSEARCKLRHGLPPLLFCCTDAAADSALAAMVCANQQTTIGHQS